MIGKGRRYGGFWGADIGLCFDRDGYLGLCFKNNVHLYFIYFPVCVMQHNKGDFFLKINYIVLLQSEHTMFCQ